MTNRHAALDRLHASLGQRMRAEDVADLILEAFRPELDVRQRDAIDRAARYSRRRRGWAYTSMAEDYARPVGAAHQLAIAERLFDVGSVDADDPQALRAVFANAAGSMRWAPGDEFAGRLDRNGRLVAGLDISKRRYNRALRFLARFAAKIDRLDTQLRQRHLLLVGRAGLVADISVDRFRADPVGACFVAYLTARRNVRRQFSLSGRDNPYDEVADMLYRRCVDLGSDWWMVSRAYSPPHVVARLTPQERGELLGRWSALMRGAADILQTVWDPRIDRRTMTVRQGMDSSTWNTMAQAYNTARSGWLSALHATGAEDLLNVALPGKVMRLMAADLAYWHQSSGGDVDPDTLVWSELPLPWDVLNGRAACARAMVVKVCVRHGVDARARGWVGPRAAGEVVRFEPTPELVHGVAIADPVWASLLRSAGVFSGKRIRAGYADVVASVPTGVVVGDLPSKLAS